MSPEPSSEAQLDRVFDALGHEYRRWLLSELADGPSNAEYDVRELTPDGGDQDELTVAAYHAHLPKLANAGFVEFDEVALTVRRGPEFDVVEPVLDALSSFREDVAQEQY